MNDKFAVCIGKGGQRDQAESFARKTESIIADKPGKNLTVLFDSKGISLTGYGLTYQGDFENMLHRKSIDFLQTDATKIAQHIANMKYKFCAVHA